MANNLVRKSMMSRRSAVSLVAAAVLIGCGFCLAAALGVSFRSPDRSSATSRPPQQRTVATAYMPPKMTPAQSQAADRQARGILTRAARAAFATAEDTKLPAGSPMFADTIVKGIEFEAPGLHVVYGPRGRAVHLRPLTVVFNERTDGWTDDMYTMSRTGTVWELYSRCCLRQHGRTRMGPLRFSVHHPFDARSGTRSS